ncbi:hypothetical protein HEK616_47450 [Streptomyces nigrescens]|uniref:Disulfide bond formation protein DsbA n=2 Tax=Streptomyces TaxID=1883 RepID=A0ABM7ZY05_STRNI|nr:disulfide bond formation protein DsbA [Streptomyces nigrescens]MEE4421627.1 disulfide bond formation protein DsbA [Streptomyces sp. DSM 41528]BDM71258.1 hypothetical protein HEK616_47450 [Streptomyces nigrescens]
MSANGTLTADFWFDPSCPYTWLTSRWLLEVAKVRPVTVRWRVMSLSILNEGRADDPEGDPEGYLRVPVRVCATVMERYGHQSLGRLYTALGTRIHERGEWNWETVLAEALDESELPREVGAVGSDSSVDDAVRASHDQGVRLLRGRTGTPVIGVSHPDEAGSGPRTAFFGPVLSRVATGEEAGRQWDAVLLLAGTPGFHQLAGTPPEEPDFTAHH